MEIILNILRILAYAYDFDIFYTTHTMLIE
jgi:hypothetical protein